MTTNDMLQAIINGQRSLKEELLEKITNVETKLESELTSLKKEMRQGFKEVNERLDKQGKQLAYLEEDAPTRDEFDKLTKRVEKLEHN